MSKFCAALFVFFAIISVWLSGSANAQTLANSTSGTVNCTSAIANTTFGTEFIIGAVNNVNASVSNITIIINSAGSNNATIFSNITGNISVPSFNGTKIVVLPGSLIPYLQGNASLGIRVITHNISSIQAFVNNTIKNGSEGLLVFPVATLGKTYLTNGVTPNEAFSVVASVDSTNVTITFRNGTKSNFTLAKSLDSLSFSKAELDGTFINASSPVAVFVGRDCSISISPIFKEPTVCGYLWEQMVPLGKFGKQFVLVNPNAPLQTGSGNSTNTTIRVVNGENVNVSVEILGITTKSKPFVLVPGRAVAFDAHNLTYQINATGLIDIQIITQSSKFENQTQWGLIPNDQFIEKARFFVESSTNSQLSLVALTSDIKNSTNSLKFNGVAFDLSHFQVSANSNYSYVITQPKQGANFMNATFKLGGYLFETKANTTNFGSIIGRSF